MATIIDRTKLRNILLGQKVSDLLTVWFTLLGDDKGILVDKILDASGDELASALNDSLGWAFRIKDRDYQ